MRGGNPVLALAAVLAAAALTVAAIDIVDVQVAGMMGIARRELAFDARLVDPGTLRFRVAGSPVTLNVAEQLRAARRVGAGVLGLGARLVGAGRRGLEALRERGRSIARLGPPGAGRRRRRDDG